MTERKDAFGVLVEVGDIVLSCPRSKWTSGPKVGQVTGVFKSGRVTMKYPSKVSIYAYQRGAPKVEQKSFRYVQDPNGTPDRWGSRPYIKEPYTYKSKDCTVVDHEWAWVKSQAADINLIVLRKGGETKKTIDEVLKVSVLSEALDLDYSTEKPDLA